MMEKIIRIIEGEISVPLKNTDILVLGNSYESQKFLEYLRSSGFKAEDIPIKNKEYDVIVKWGESFKHLDKYIKPKGLLVLLGSKKSFIRVGKYCKTLKILSISSSK